MLSYITTYGLMLLFYYFFFRTVKVGVEKGSGKLKDILSGNGEPGVIFIRLISGIFLLGMGTAIISIKRNIDAGIFTVIYKDYNTSVWIIIAAAIILGVLSALKETYPSNNSSHSLPFYLPLLFVLVRTLFLIVYEFFFPGSYVVCYDRRSWGSGRNCC